MLGAESDPQAWVELAESDLSLAQSIADTFTRQASFSLQQSVEKSLKALIVARAQRPPHTHSLIVLHDLVQSDLELELDPIWLEGVSRWVTSSRYPTVEDGFPLPDPATLRASILIAKALLAEVRSKLA